ncbi:hypothetical protein OEB99_11555 [Actinotalea sp. M2MS4P-6]|uniref:hypothetical protein n=1 Tax=Actinotalea sp. M2MS4P-6 TaxID=2983762 RepID=UPI0021E4089E|nr:hypothetical protein [Actinotalea sp. M2MS4P-6]MCV2394945.1 hypothetical protein [Actinotalea sp. M2MS4P-6]
MSAQGAADVPWWRGFFAGLRRGVREGRLSRWRAAGVVGGLAASGLIAAGLTTLLCYGVVRTLVGIARGGAEPRWNDPVLLTVTVAVCIVVIPLAAVGARRRRLRLAVHQARMRGWAEAHGWAYQPRSRLLSSRWDAPGTPTSTWVRDVLTRATPRGEVTSLTLGLGRDWTRWATHAVMVAGPRRFPALHLTPMAVHDRVDLALGGQDIAVESYQINERWRVRCADLRFAHEVAHPRLLERLDRAAFPGLSLLVEGRDVVVHVPGPTDLVRVEGLAELVLDLADLVPAYLTDDYPPHPPHVPRRERRRPPRRVR